MSIAVAISFGLKLPDADWMAIAAIIAMKPSLQQSALVGVERLAGTIVGAAVAVLVLLAVDNRTALAGVGIAIIVLLLAGLLQKRAAKAAPPAPKAPQPSPT